MFIGHYAVAPLAASTGKVKLWEAFIAVQLVDYAWVVLVLMGVEKASIEPGFTQGNPLVLHFIPYTHSLLFVFGWSVLGALLFLLYRRFLPAKVDGPHENAGVKMNVAGALITALLVISHWFLDYVVHAADLTLWPGSVRVGLGLWNHVAISFPLEVLILIGGFIYYLRVSDNLSQFGIVTPIAFLGFMTLSQAYANFGPPPNSISELMWTLLFAFTVLAILAAVFARTRRLRLV